MEKFTFSAVSLDSKACNYGIKLWQIPKTRWNGKHRTMITNKETQGDSPVEIITTDQYIYRPLNFNILL